MMKAEILAPAGDEQSAYAALDAGADAVYLGLSRFSARAGATNFDAGALRRVTLRAHLLGAKVYVALNTLVKDGELEAFFAHALEAWNCGADALLIQDLFLGRALKSTYPEMILHLSTQGGCCNLHGALLAREYGFSRVVLARETPVADMGAISSVIETEVFVQGALCTCFSGQCYMSSFAGNNSGNRGRCKQPCRKLYSIDRRGYEAPAYALSLADLSAGERMRDFLAAGVTSLKIEGRMRRPEYVAAAVKYCRAVLGGACGEEDLSRLKRTYNRGDYTHGLAFGQDKTFLSRRVQGHIGEEVGVLSVKQGKYFCESSFAARQGDGFKILRNGLEVGGATFAGSGKGGFFLASQAKLLAGDSVRVTTDAATNESLLAGKRRRSVSLTLRFVAGERAEMRSGDFVLYSDNPLPAARSAPLTKEELKSCFEKTDGLPLAPQIELETESAFLPKSALNALRRAFWDGFCRHHVGGRPSLNAREVSFPRIQTVSQTHTAVIGETCAHADICILKPRDYSALPAGGKHVYLYLPPLFTAKDEELVAPYLKQFEGVYCEGYFGLALAKKYGVKLFAGTGFNLTNAIAVAGVKEAGATYFALSKELSYPEQKALAAEGAFALASGGIKVMDLCYCPFERTCSSCDRRVLYTLTDDMGRAFPLRRYVLNGCRFEVYNCAPLSSEGEISALHDKTVLQEGGATRGHFNRSML